MNHTIEKLVCETILQEPLHITVNGENYAIAPPVASTLIEASKYISQLPDISLSGDNIQTALAYAADCEFTADVVAILILGRKNLRSEKRRCYGLLKPQIIDNQKQLSQILLDELTWREISELGKEILSKLEIGFFLGFTTSLLEVNMLKVTKMTQSGQ